MGFYLFLLLLEEGNSTSRPLVKYTGGYFWLQAFVYRIWINCVEADLSQEERVDYERGK